MAVGIVVACAVGLWALLNVISGERKRRVGDMVWEKRQEEKAAREAELAKERAAAVKPKPGFGSGSARVPFSMTPKGSAPAASATTKSET